MKSSETLNGEILLPEPMIQLIQSFLTGKEAARTTVLSKSWYTAWLTRPTFDFDERDFNYVRSPEIGFAEAMTKSMQRYHDSNMKIDNFRLRLASYFSQSSILTYKLIVSALQRGATELDLDFRSGAYDLPRELLESEHLLRLSLVNMNLRAIDGNVRCWRIKSLVLHRVRLGSDAMIRDILSRCLLIEELSLSLCTRAPSLDIPYRSSIMSDWRRMNMKIDLSGMNMFKLHKLRRLRLKKVRFDPSFFYDFASRFPCLRDLSVSECCCEAIRIASTSLESMSFVEVKALFTAEFDVPNLVSFRYSGEEIPSLRIESSREWESDITITTHAHSNSCYLLLKKFLTQLRPSKMSLSMGRRFKEGCGDIKVVSEPLDVENLTIDRPPGFGSTILSGLLSICHPKFITVCWNPYPSRFTEEKNLCKRVKKEIITPNCDGNMFGHLGLMEASVEVLDVDHQDPWLPLFFNQPLHALTAHEYQRKLRFRLRWE